MKRTNIPTSKKLLFALLFSGTVAFAQNPQQVQKITENYNKTELQELSLQLTAAAKAEKAEAVAYAKAHNLPVSEITKDGAFVEVQKLLPDGTLLYYSTTNKDAARSTRTNHINTGGSLGLNLNGENMSAHVWDGGHPRVTHMEYKDANGNERVHVRDAEPGAHTLNFHAAHVVGTVGAAGFNGQAKGMAPEATVNAYDWNSDAGEASAATLEGMLVSNHSYGLRLSSVPDWMFGAYTGTSRQWDNIAYYAPYYLTVTSAGNDGRSTSANGSPLAPGYDILSAMATAKNTLVVANANDANVDNNGNLISVSLDGTSSPGPTDDFRIKPDITGNGVGVFSTLETSNASYGSLSGTSMSSPNVTGSLLLLQQHYEDLNGRFMRAATLKGLALHTADDAGPNGPDAKWGWGLLNAKRAAETITENGVGTLIEELVLVDGQTITFEVTADGINDLIASISWTDLPGEAVYNITNSDIPVLVNDLDIRVTKNNDTFYPWRLTSPTTNSKDGDNKVDPFERVDVANASGTYTITISHKGTLETGGQPFSLILTGVQIECSGADVPENLAVTQTTDDSALISWDPIIGNTYDLRYRRYIDTNWTEVTNISGASYTLTDLEFDMQYEVQVRSHCSGSASAYSSTTTFDIGCVFDIVTEVEAITRVIFGGIDNSSSATSTEVMEDFTDIVGEVHKRATYDIAVEGNTNGAKTDYITVWIDWNHDGDYTDEGEMFEIGSIQNSTGTDGQQATASIEIPRSARLGEATMRVIKTSGASPVDPCLMYDRGQAEEYTLLVSNLVGIDDQKFNDFTYYPNPTEDKVYIDSKTNVSQISVFNILGQQVINSTEKGIKEVDMSALTQGTYMFKVIFEDGSIENFKILKN